jgi:hypothetical protein
VHISIGLIILFHPKIFKHAFPSFVICLIFILINASALRMQWHAGTRDGHLEISAIVMLVMALGVGAAAIAGQAVHCPHYYSLSSNRKSLKDPL